MSINRHYDVIIIGTGAGGGTLAHKLAPSGKRSCSSSAATTCRARRTTGTPQPSTSKASTRPRKCGATQDGKALHPHTNYYVGGNTKFYGAALFRLRREDFGEIQPLRRRSRRPGRSPTTIWSPTTRRPSSSTTCTASAAKIRPSRRPAAPYPHPAVSHEPRIQQLERRLCAPGPEAVSRAARHHARREEPAQEQVHPLQHLRRLSVPGPREVRRAGAAASIRRCGYPNVTLLTNAYVERLETDASGREVTSVDRRAQRRDRDSYSAESWSSFLRRDQLGGAAAALGQRQAPARPRQRLGRRRPALHGPRQLGPDGDLEVPEPDRLSEDARGERFLLRLGGLEVSRWATSPLSASSTA